MIDASFSLTLRFFDSIDYRTFLLRVRHLRSSHGNFLGVLQGTARIYANRNLSPREIILKSHGNLTDILFDLRQWFDPQKILLHDFTAHLPKDFLRDEFKRCLYACIHSSSVCFEKPDDPESFHQFRLDIRAFRSLLQCAQKSGVEGLDEICSRTRNMAKASNNLRDLDVRIGLYEKFDEPIPASLIRAREHLLNDAVDLLRGDAANIWLIGLRYFALSQIIEDSEQHFSHYLIKQTKKAAKRWRKLDLKDDPELHALRIRMKMLSYGYGALRGKEDEITDTAKSIKAIQSRLGDVRDLRSFYILPGLDTETRYRAVQKLSSLERELEEMEIG